MMSDSYRRRKEHPELGGPAAEFFVERWQAMLGTCIGQDLSAMRLGLKIPRETVIQIGKLETGGVLQNLFELAK